MDYFGELDKLVAPEYLPKANEYHPIQQHLQSVHNYTPERLMYWLMQPCEQLVTNCTWLGKQTPCNQMFRVAKSTEGFCCSFNYKAPRYNLEV